jgi:phosphate transport system permease protein
MSTVVPRTITTHPRVSDRLYRGVLTAGALAVVLILGLITYFLYVRSKDVFTTFGWGFITNVQWIPDDGNTMASGSYGIAAMLTGTLLTSFLALLFGVPVAVGLALFLTQYAPTWLRAPLTLLVDLMASIPSVVYGLWGFFVLMPHAVYWAKLLHKWFGWIPVFDVPVPIFDRSPFIAGLVLAVMIIPIVTAVAREVFAQAPRDRIEAAYALGATKWAAIRAVVIPHGRAGVIGGAMLGLGRAIGETVAVYMVLNLAFDINWRILQSAGGSVASLIVNKFGEATTFEIQGLMAAGLVLFALTLVVNLAANAIVRATSRRG